MSDPDVVVVGAGPAGALAAARLASAGRRVMLVDRTRFPRDKVCGGCLQPSALRALEVGGLGGLVERGGGVPLREMALVAAGGAAARFPLEGGMAITRRALDAALVEAARARGVEVREGVHARLGPAPGEVVLDGLGAVRAGIVLDATGLHGGLSRSRRRSLLGAGTVLDEAPVSIGTVRMACARGGYVGMVRAEGGRGIVAAALAPKLVAREGGLGAAVASILAACRLPPLTGNAPWRGTPALTRRPARVWHERVLVLGDAAGYVEPFTGEGMAWAMRSGLAAADLALEGWTATTGPRWERAHRDIVGSRQRRCRALTLLLRSPALVRAAVRILALAPALARPFVRAAASGSAS